MARFGVLALQGDFEAHARALGELDVDAVEVRRTRELASLAGLILPGGESSTLLNLMRDEPWFEALRSFQADGGALFGTCAGAILLSRAVLDPEQPSVGLLDATIRRNGWGRQVDSFEAPLTLADSGETVPGVFIRAPRFTELGDGVRVHARLEEEPVALIQGRVLATTFHPELARDRRIHRQFLELAGSAAHAGHVNPQVVPAQAGERRVRC
jgi:5'-phosphate synthase pdxT subunit